jgi:hypothetical protein
VCDRDDDDEERREDWGGRGSEEKEDECGVDTKSEDVDEASDEVPVEGDAGAGAADRGAVMLSSDFCSASTPSTVSTMAATSMSAAANT